MALKECEHSKKKKKKKKKTTKSKQKIENVYVFTLSI